MPCQSELPPLDALVARLKGSHFQLLIVALFGKLVVVSSGLFFGSVAAQSNRLTIGVLATDAEPPRHRFGLSPIRIPSWHSGIIPDLSAER